MKKSITFISLFLCLGLSQAQEKLSLFDAINTGLQNNYDLQMQRNSTEIAGINNSWGNTSFMPDVSFDATAQEYYNYNDDENYRTQTITPELSLDWVLFNGFSARINKRKYEELEQQSEGNTVVLVESTIQDIIMAYNNCLVQQELVNVYQELADLSKDRYDRTLNSQAIGASTTYEGLQAKVSMLEDQSNLLQQKVNYDNAIRTLNYLMAVEDETQWSLTTALTAETPDYNLESLSEKLGQNNQTLKNQYLYQSIIAKDIALAKSAYSPSLTAYSSVSHTNSREYYSGSTANVTENYAYVYAGLTLSLDIFNGGTRKRSLQIAKINEETTQVQTTQMEHSLKNQLLQMYSNYEVQKTVYQLTLEQEEAAKLNLELSAEKLENGSINSFNYRDVQIDYMNAAISKLNAIYNLLQSNTDLQRITGGIINEYQ
jgi:outer membrane protein TolC